MNTVAKNSVLHFINNKSKMLWILLFFSAMAWAQPTIVNPTPYQVCDDNNDGFAGFDLTTKDAEILGTNAASDYTVSYHATLTDAQNNDTELFSPYINNNAYTQTVYVRVQENANPSNFATTTLNLVVLNLPTIPASGYYPQLETCETGAPLGIEIFDLTTAIPTILNGQTGISVTFYLSLADAQAGINAIANPSAYSNTVAYTQTLGVALTNTTTGCTSYATMDLVVNNSVGIISGNQYLCGTTTTTQLSSTVSGGTWSSSNTAVATVDATGLVTATGVGNTTIIYTLPANGSCTMATATHSITVYSSCTDTDGDGVIDVVEVVDGTDPTQLCLFILAHQTVTPTAIWDNSDCDSDGLANTQEVTAGTNLQVADTDGDGVLDSAEVADGTNPLQPCSYLAIHQTVVTTVMFNNTDCDGDGLTNGQEVAIGTNTFCSDTDGDGVTDSIEYIYGTDPTNTELFDIEYIGSSIAGNSIVSNGSNTLSIGETRQLSCSSFGGVWSSSNTQVATISSTGLLTAIGNGIAIIGYNSTNTCLNSSYTVYVGSVNLSISLDSFYFDTNGDGLVSLGDEVHYNIIINNSGIDTASNVTVAMHHATVLNPVVTIAGNSQVVLTASHIITLNDFYNNMIVDSAYIGNINSTDPTPCTNCYSLGSPISDWTFTTFESIVYAGCTNTISGHINFDYDNNGCTTTDSPASYMPILVQSTAQQFYTYANYDGSYTINVPQGNYTITPQLQWNQPGFVVNPTSANVNFATNNYVTATQDFCISIATPITDVEIGTYYLNALRPGFDSTFVIYYRNAGNQIVSGNVSFNFDATYLDFLSASSSGSVSGGNASWTYSNLLPSEIRYIIVTLHTHSPTDTLPVNIGETYPFSANITPTTDANPSNNSMSFNATVVGSYDPNNIICTEGNQLPVSEIGNYLHYTVNFENTGNYPADFINVRIPIDTNLYDVNSLEIVGTSHHFQPKLQNNILDVLFPNIMLDTGGHGNVLLKIKSKNTLNAGDIASKHAEIYFDYNTPVDTGYANTVYQTLSSQIIEQDNLVTIYPNPANTNVTITAQNELQKIEIYDAQGRLVLEKLCGNEKQTTLDVSSRATGLYFIKITTDKGSKIEKLVKE